MRYSLDAYLAHCLSSHLRAEFPHLCWPDDWTKMSQTDISDDLLGKLQLVGRRRTFVGVCEICRQWQGAPGDPPTTTQALGAWRAHINSGCLLPKSVESYENIARFVERNFPQNLPTTPDEIESALAKLELAPNTRRDYIKKLKVLFNFLEERLGAVNPMTEVKTPKKVKTGVPWLSAEDMERITTAPLKPDWGPFAERDYAFLRLLRRSGLRASSALRLRQRDIAIDEFQGFTHLTITVKGGKLKQAICDDETGRLLQELGGDFVFRNKNSKPLSYHGARLVIKRALQAAGLDHEGQATHLFRRGFATQMNASGVPTRTLQALLHHEQIAQTSEYIRLNNEELVRQYKQAWQGQLTLTPG